jgi:hypothetical protein
MTRTWIMVLGFVFFGWLLTAQAAPADKTTQHVVGTVTTIDNKHIIVKTPKGHLMAVKLTKQVRFKDKRDPRSNEPPAVGDHVIIEATKQDKTLTATVVYYSPMKQAPAIP